MRKTLTSAYDGQGNDFKEFTVITIRTIDNISAFTERSQSVFGWLFS